MEEKLNKNARLTFTQIEHLPLLPSGPDGFGRQPVKGVWQKSKFEA